MPVTPETKRVLTAAAAGYALALLLFFALPLAVNPSVSGMFGRYLPFAPVPGNDLKTILEFNADYYSLGASPYSGENYYPPFSTLFFAPFVFSGHTASYIIILALTLFLYSVYVFILPAKLTEKKYSFFAAAGILAFLSYGFLFELERGQFNTIAYTFAALGVWLFHKKPRLRFLSYVLITVAAQLKLYPAIFALMLVDDWSLWKKNLYRFAGLAAVNFLLLFILGAGIFRDFINNVTLYSSDSISWTGNHSISSFIKLVSEKAVERLGMGWLAWTAAISAPLNYFLLGVYLILTGDMIRSAVKRKEKGFSEVLFFACAIGAMIIPPVSHDYKLALLYLPAALILQGYVNKQYNVYFVFLISFLVSMTMFPYSFKPLYLGNNFPVLFALFILVWAHERFFLRRNLMPEPGTQYPD